MKETRIDIADLRHGVRGLRLSFIGCAARFVNRQTAAYETTIDVLRNRNEPRNRNRFTGFSLCSLRLKNSVAKPLFVRGSK